jgi:hypothetical protein
MDNVYILQPVKLCKSICDIFKSGGYLTKHDKNSSVLFFFQKF